MKDPTVSLHKTIDAGHPRFSGDRTIRYEGEIKQTTGTLISFFGVKRLHQGVLGARKRVRGF